MVKIKKSEKEWKEKLTPEQFRIMRKKSTEPAFTSKLHDKKDKGMYVCAACGAELFSSDAKFDSKTGWPSFSKPYKDENVETQKDFKLIIPRTEIHCAKCGGHLGHIFNDGPKPTGKRYCINGVALKFKKG